MSSKKPRVLVVDDDPGIRKLVEYNLGLEGYDVLVASGGKEALRRAQNETPDLVLLDLNLPGMDGLDVAREIRRKGSTPIIMMTARVEEADQLIGLELGADDYIPKPFSPKLVVARVRALLRRSEAAPSMPQVLRLAGLEIDLEGHIVLRDGDLLELTPTEFNLLSALAGQPGRVFSRLHLLEATQGSAYEGYERTIDAHIKNLRSKLEVDPKNPQFIETVFGVGYRFMRSQS